MPKASTWLVLSYDESCLFHGSWIVWQAGHLQQETSQGSRQVLCRHGREVWSTVVASFVPVLVWF